MSNAQISRVSFLVKILSNTFILLLFMLFGGPLNAANSFLFPHEKVIGLPFTAGELLYTEDNKYLLIASSIEQSVKSASPGKIIALDVGSLKQSKEFELTHSISGMVHSSEENTLYVVGDLQNLSGSEVRSNTVVTAISLDNGNSYTIDLGGKLVLPSITLGGNNSIFISDYNSNQITELRASAFKSENNATFSKLLAGGHAQTYPIDLSLPVREIAISDDNGTAFVTTDFESKLFAADLENFGEIVAEAGYSLTRRQALLPFTIDQGNDGYFVVGDHQLGTIYLYNYNKKFRSIDLITAAQLSLNLLPRTILEREQDTNAFIQPLLIGSDKTQSVIIVANRYSKTVALLSANFELGYLERIANYGLVSSPTAAAVAADGKQVAVGMVGRNELWVLNHSESENSETPKDVQLRGDPTLRELQRFLTSEGWAVGVVDGLWGKNTLHALRLAMKTKGIKQNQPLSLLAKPRNLEELITTLKDSEARGQVEEEPAN